LTGGRGRGLHGLRAPSAQQSGRPTETVRKKEKKKIALVRRGGEKDDIYDLRRWRGKRNLLSPALGEEEKEFSPWAVTSKERKQGRKEHYRIPRPCRCRHEVQGKKATPVLQDFAKDMKKKNAASPGGMISKFVTLPPLES